MLFPHERFYKLALIIGMLTLVCHNWHFSMHIVPTQRINNAIFVWMPRKIIRTDFYDSDTCDKTQKPGLRFHGSRVMRLFSIQFFANLYGIFVPFSVHIRAVTFSKAHWSFELISNAVHITDSNSSLQFEYIFPHIWTKFWIKSESPSAHGAIKWELHVYCSTLNQYYS